MSTAADHDSYDEEDWFEVDGGDADGAGPQGPRYIGYEPYYDGYLCSHEGDCGCDQPPDPMSDPGLADLLEGPATDAMYGLGMIRDVPAAKVPPAVMVQAVLGAQRLISWARAQQHRWTAALARPGVAVPVSDVLDSVAHRNQEPGSGTDIPEELADRAAAGAEVIGDPVWDALLAAEAASLAEPELSAAWLVAPITARRRIADAQELVDELPDTFAALEQGRIEEVRARIIAETTAVLEPDLRRRAEALILDRAQHGMCPGDLRRLASKVVADIDPDAAAERAEQARARRGTGVRNLGDDLGRFTADLAAEDATLTQAVLDLLATAIPPEARHGRGISQLRADIFADLFGELADTGLIDLRGINPTEPEPTDTAGPSPADVSDPADLSDPANVSEPADGSEPPDPSEPAGPEPAQPATSEGDCETPTAPPEAGGAGRPPRDETAEPGTAHSDQNEAAADQAGTADPPSPTAAELLTRLRSIDWESWLDPNCARRGGLLSTIRLPAGVRVNLDVTVALSTLAGCDDLSARLAGLGVITADTARALAKAAGTVRILLTTDPPDPPAPPGGPSNGPPSPGSPPHQGPPAHRSPSAAPTGGSGWLAVDPTDPDRPTAHHHGGIHHGSPDCGSVLDFGRTAYRPPATVIDRVDTRDQRCRFPGCPQTALHCDHDHRTPWDDGGATCPCDLDALCRFHHRAKTFTAWSATRDQQANTLTWTSPLGRANVDRPAPDLPTGTPMNLADPPAAERLHEGTPTADAGWPSDDESAESEIGSADSDLPPF